jgi:hypothetical protein
MNYNQIIYPQLYQLYRKNIFLLTLILDISVGIITLPWKSYSYVFLRKEDFITFNDFANFLFLNKENLLKNMKSYDWENKEKIYIKK